MSLGGNEFHDCQLPPGANGPAIAAVAALVLAVGVVVAGAGTAWADPTGSITITPPEGAADGQSYSVYKVFDATGNGTNISYKLLDGKSTSDGAWTTSGMGTYFSVDAAGNVAAQNGATGEDGKLTQGAINAIGSYVTSASITATATANVKNAAGKYMASGLADGYYYVTTTTGTVVTIDSVNGQQNVDVNDKNTQPSIDKYITAVQDDAGSVTSDRKSAIAQVGKKVTFDAAVTIGNGAKGYVFRDTFPTGNKLALDTASIKVYRLDADQEASDTTLVDDNLVNGSNYTLSTSPTSEDTWTFQISFHDDYTKGLTAGQRLIVVYDATVTSNALSNDKATNSATISWGDPDHQTTSTPSTTDVYNAKITVNKTFQGLEENGSLTTGQKAEFVLKRSNTDGTSVEFYKYDDSANAASWVSDEAQATKIEFTKAGAGIFYGLSNGSYTLVEVTWPNGYNKAADTSITINAAGVEGGLTTANLEKTANIENKTGSVLPSTGGAGTVAFYVVGGVLVVGAIAYLVHRRKANANA